jgi:hypothetical protein
VELRPQGLKPRLQDEFVVAQRQIPSDGQLAWRADRCEFIITNDKLFGVEGALSELALQNVGLV